MIIKAKIKEEIGARVCLKKDTPLLGIVYNKGHEFTICDIGPRGWDIISDNGVIVREAGLIWDRFRIINKVKIKIGG